MKILLAVPLHHQQGAVFAHLASAVDDRPGAVRVDIDTLTLALGDEPQAHRYDNITAKSERARQMAVAGDYDALWLVDDDQVVPVDALERLIAAEADIAYGLTVWRNTPHRWSAVIKAEGDDVCVTLDMQPDRAREAWGQVVDVVGCGTFCTLLRRRVFEAVRFERRGRHCYDWYLAEDAVRLGFTQRCDTGLIVPHLDDRCAAMAPAIDENDVPGWAPWP